MKVVILGPVLCERITGGVAVFDENLQRGFLERGDECSIITLEKTDKKGVISIGGGRFGPNEILIVARKFGQAIKRIKPDLVISSVQYSAGILTYKKFWKNATYISVLHGTPCPSNGLLKAWILNKLARFSKRHFDRIVTMSFMSAAVNEKINRVVCDAVIPNGISYVDSPTGDQCRDLDFLYIGRLYKDKNVDKIAKAFLLLSKKRPELRFGVAGAGEMSDLFTKGPFVSPNIIFFGAVNHDEVCTLYRRAKVFVSICELECFGTTFMEAVVQGCNLLSSYTGGQNQLFIGKPYFHAANTMDIGCLEKDLEDSIDGYVEIPNSEMSYLMESFSVKNWADKYAELVNDKNSSRCSND